MEGSNLRKVRPAREERIWADPLRACRTLLSFAETEEDGGRDLVRAARRVADGELRSHLVRHAGDERRHAELLRRRAQQLALVHALPAASVAPFEGRFDFAGVLQSTGGRELDAHGFYSAGLIDDLGELEYVAMLQVAESRAAALFTRCRDASAHDPETRALFDEILRDEAFHVSYTRLFLERWREQGRGFEVDRALREARRGRRLHAWRRLSARAAAGLSRVALLLLYWTLLAPVACVARAQSLPAGWQARPPESDPPDPLGQH